MTSSDVSICLACEVQTRISLSVTVTNGINTCDEEDRNVILLIDQQVSEMSADRTMEIDEEEEDEEKPKNFHEMEIDDRILKVGLNAYEYHLGYVAIGMIGFPSVYST